MAGKKNLDDMLAQETPRPPIRRGQGIRLSTDTTPDAPAPAAATQQTEEAQAHMLESAQARKIESAQTHTAESADAGKIESAQVRERTNAPASEPPRAPAGKRTSAQAPSEPERVTRVSQGQRLRVDLVKQLKRIAVEEDRKLYEVMEEAIEQYIERRKESGG